MFALALLFALNILHNNASDTGTCCSYPVEAFILREFYGPCACQTLQQKWRRYVDWIQMNGGYIHPWLEYNYAHAFAVDDDKYLNLYSHEKGMFANIAIADQVIEPNTLVMQIPFSTTFSQPLLSQYIHHAAPPSNPVLAKVLNEPACFMPASFPDWTAFLNQTGIDTIVGWLALGFAWLKQYTYELLPWFELLPTSNYLLIQWDDNEREALLKGTAALRIFTQHTLKAYKSAVPYIDMLGLTEAQLRYAVAMIGSRSFALEFDGVEDDIIPAGIDFYNHNVDATDELYYDEEFEFSKKAERLLLKNRGMQKVRDIDIASMYLIMKEVIHNGSEIFINYGLHLSSADRVAHYGFMDKVHPQDYHELLFDLNQEDVNYEIKKRLFHTVWNWTEMKENQSPLFGMNYNGRIQSLINDEILFRLLRLLYLKAEHFDSFTINSILNGFEYDYLETVIDPEFHRNIHKMCMDSLEQFPNTQYMDHLLLKKVGQERYNILELMEKNGNKNWTESERLGEILAAIDRRNLVIRYRIRERNFLHQCSSVTFVPRPYYLLRRKRRKR